MALADIDISKPKAAAAADASLSANTRGPHPAARFLPLIATLLLAGAIAFNVVALQTTSWLKTTAYPTLFNTDGVVQTGVNGDVLTRLSASEVCYAITNPTPPVQARDYCVGYNTKDKTAFGVDMSLCELVDAKEALNSTGVEWDSDEPEFLRLVCGGLGDAVLGLQFTAIVVGGVATLAVLLSCPFRSRAGRMLRVVATVAAVVSAALALTTYIVWLTKLSSGDVHHGRSAVYTAGSMFLFGGAALASSSGLDIFASAASSSAAATDDEQPTDPKEPESAPLPSAIAA